MKEFSKILVIKTGALGDLVLASVFFQNLRDHFPGSRLFLLTQKRYREVVEDCPLFEKVYLLPGRFWEDVRLAAAKLRRERFNLVIDFQGSTKSNLISFLTGAENRVGVSSNFLARCLFSHSVRRCPPVNPVDSQFPMLEKLGARKFSRKLQVWVSENKRKEFHRFMQENGLDSRLSWVILAPLSSPEWLSKRWPQAHFADLADHLAAAGCQVIFVGDSQPELAGITGLMKQPAVNLAGKTGFSDLVLLMEKAALLVTTDSAPLHIGVAVGIPTVVLFGPTDPQRHCPEGAVYIHHEITCSPCYRRRCSRMECMKSITVGEVLQKASGLSNVIPADRKQESTVPVSIIIPSWNGKELLKENLPSVLAALDFHHPEDELMVVDNASSDGSCQYLTEHFPVVRILRLDKNRGFGQACNCAVAQARHRIFILLNNDVRVQPDFIEPLVRHFSDSQVFSVSALSLGKDRKKEKVPETACRVSYASGGYSAFDREKFLALAGFHPIYQPFYYEDRDLGYRARKKGWKNILEPKSVVFHRGEATVRRLDRRQVECVKFRNRLIFYFTCYDNLPVILGAVGKLVAKSFWSFQWSDYRAFFTLYRMRLEIRKKIRDSAHLKNRDSAHLFRADYPPQP